MGQKIGPISFRLGITKPWQSRWFFHKGSYKNFLMQDEVVRKVIKEKISTAGVIAVDIERTAGRCKIYIKAARPGLIIGRGGKGIEELARAIKVALVKLHKKYPSIKESKSLDISLNIEELKRNEISAQYVAQQIAWDLEKRISFRRCMKKYLDQILQNKEAKGAKIRLTGRLDGAEIARDEALSRGKLPLQTLRANIDYGTATAFTTYGTVGVKVWIYKGDIFVEKEGGREKRARNSQK